MDVVDRIRKVATGPGPSGHETFRSSLRIESARVIGEPAKPGATPKGDK
jgi:hypothetical protein